MAEFLDLLENIKAEDASVSRLFNGEGTRVRGRGNTPKYQADLREAVKLVADVSTGRRPFYHLREALTTADFPLLFGDIIDRQLLANYREAPQTYRNYCSIKTVSDFRTVKRFAINGSEAVLAAVPQQDEYPESKLTDASYSYAVQKYGRAIPFSWEAIINDDLDALKDIPARFGKAARRSEEKFATQLFVDTNGPLAAFYSTANKNRVHSENTGGAINNPPLSIAALQQAFQVLMAQKDADGEPIVYDTVELVVPPALFVIAENILNATELWLNAGNTATDAQSLHTVNWMRQRVHLNVNYYLPVVATTNGNTAWFLFASPTDSRPALEFGHLRGHEEPEVFMKSPDQTRVGGGENPMDGDFYNDSIRYKVRHVFGGVTIDPKATVASNGSGV